jgi:hypothetical protein
MRIVEVNDMKTVEAFINLPRQLYKNDPNWISPLDEDIASVFDPQKNSYFQQGICKRWILSNGAGKIIGRIAAFVNHEKANSNGMPAGGVGFFECVDKNDAASKLFDTARDWLKQQGMKAMNGPINFGENDKYWGLLVVGFQPPSLGMNYNPQYYEHLFTDYGFEKDYDQLTNFLDVRIPLPDRFAKIADRVMSKPEYSFDHFRKSNKEKYFHDFMEIYNDAWVDFENFTPMKIESVRDSFRQMKPIMDEKMIWFAYNEKEPVGFVVSLPDVNQILKHVNGKMNLLGKLKFLWYSYTSTVDRLRIVIMGTKKKFQNHGIECALIQVLKDAVLPHSDIKGVELAWVGDFNPKMIAIHKATGATLEKVHRTYKYIFKE